MRSCLSPLEWDGLYGPDNMYRPLLTKASYAHPAKTSLRLVDKIYSHLRSQGLINPTDTIIDFMSGTGRINLIACLYDHKTISVELEPHFIKMINDARTRLADATGRSLKWQIVQGDARELSKILGKRGVGIISPPYFNETGSPKNYKMLGKTWSVIHNYTGPKDTGPQGGDRTSHPASVGCLQWRIPRFSIRDSSSLW